MKSEIKIGFADYTVLVFIPDPASTDGSGKTGLVAANLTVSYTRVETDNDVAVTDVTSSLNNLAALTTAHTDWGLLEVSSTLAPGLYRLDIADAVFASGAWTAVVYVMITTSAAAASPMEFNLVAFDPLDTVRLGLTALPNAAADAAGGLVISDAGGLDIDDLKADINTIDDFLDTEIAAIKAKTDNLPATPANEATLTTISGYLDTEVAAILAAVDTEVAAIKAKTDNLPTDPADDSDIDAQLATIAGYLDTEVAAIKAKTDNLPASPANEATLTTIATYIDAEVAAIKTKTDQLTFTAANQLDANVQSVNDVELTGDGSATPWGPA